MMDEEEEEEDGDDNDKEQKENTHGQMSFRQIEGTTYMDMDIPRGRMLVPLVTLRNILRIVWLVRG